MLGRVSNTALPFHAHYQENNVTCTRESMTDNDVVWKTRVKMSRVRAQLWSYEEVEERASFSRVLKTAKMDAGIKKAKTSWSRKVWREAQLWVGLQYLSRISHDCIIEVMSFCVIISTSSGLTSTSAPVSSKNKSIVCLELALQKRRKCQKIKHHTWS